MKNLLLIALCAAALTAPGQEKLSREECLKYAFAAAGNLKEMLATPIPTDPDVKRPVAVRDGDYGGMLLPESKLAAETFAKAGKTPMAIGQLWLVKVAPVSDAGVIGESKLRMVHVTHGDQEADVACCALAAAKDANGDLQLWVYGKAKEPVLRVPLKTISGSQEDPVDISAERKDEGGLVTLRFVGKYEASFMVTDPNQ